MVEDYQKALEKFFAHGYGCYVFKHGIRGDRPRIPDGMSDFADLLPLEFFENLGCPPASTPVKAKVVEVHPEEAAKDPVEGTVVEELGRLFRSYKFWDFFLRYFGKVRCFATKIHTIPFNPWRFLAHCTGSFFNKKNLFMTANMPWLYILKMLAGQ